MTSNERQKCVWQPFARYGVWYGIWWYGVDCRRDFFLQWLLFFSWEVKMAQNEGQTEADQYVSVTCFTYALRHVY